MKLAIVYYSETGNTQKAAELIKAGMEQVEGVQAELFALDQVDESCLADAKAVVFGAPTFYADTCWQMKKWFDETKFSLAGKLGAVFGTAGYLQGGCEVGLQNNLVRMMCKGMVCYSGGTAMGQPPTHLGALALDGHVEEQKEQFIAFGARIAEKAKELF